MRIGSVRAFSVGILTFAAGQTFPQSNDESYWESTYNPSWYIAPSVSALFPDSDWNPDDTGFGLGLKFGKPLSPSWDRNLAETGLAPRTET